MSDMNLNTDQSEFENEIANLKLDYGKFNVETEKIFIELTNKKINKTISGMVGIDTLPTHFSNYKLFESFIK
jgi:hypothetical protein